MVGVYDSATGALVSVGTRPDPVPPGLAVAELPAGAVYGVTHTWQSAPPQWVPMPPAEVTRMSAGDFMRRLGFARESYLNAVRRNPATPLELGGQLDTLAAWIQRVTTSGVDLDDPLVPVGVELMAQVLANGGQLPEGVAAFRAHMLRRTP